VRQVVYNTDHQRGDTECGVYCLFFVRARLHGTPPAWFDAHRVPDASMERLRAGLFAH